MEPKYVQMNTNELLNIKAEPIQRIGAGIVDSIIYAALLVILFFTIDRMDVSNFDVTLIICIFVLIAFLNIGVPLITKGKTLGKIFVGIKIVKTDSWDGNLTTFSVRYSYDLALSIISVIPYVGKVVAGILSIISLIMLFTDEHSQTLQDKVAKTYVVDEEGYKKLQIKYAKLRNKKRIQEKMDLEE